MRGVARVRIEIASARIEHGRQSIVELKRGESSAGLSGTQDLVLEPMLRRASQGTGYDRAIGRPDHQATGDLHQRAAVLLLELTPKLIRPLHQRHVQRMLEVHLSNYPAVTVRGPELVAGGVLLEA
jgi:hypothetical protein